MFYVKKLIFLHILISVFSNLFAETDRTYTHGHISSFFKQSERPSPIVEYRTKKHNQLNLDKAYPNLLKLDTNYFAMGLWATEERSNYTWSNFIKLATKLQKDRPNTSLIAYIRSPTYGQNKHFCWDENLTNNTCIDETNYNNFILWAEKVAELHNKFPIVKGILIDDFADDMSHDDSDNRLLSPEYLAQINTAGKTIYSDFTLDAVFYLNTISAYHAKRFENVIDGVLFFYYHLDTNGTRHDPNPARVQNEIELFNRSFSQNKSTLATIFRRPPEPSIKNDTFTAQALIDISNVSTDMKIVYWDNTYDTSVNGFAKIKLILEDETILEQDLSEGVSGNGLQILTIPAKTINAIQKSSATLKLKVITTRNYSRWSYLINIFILDPKNIPIKWNILHNPSNAHVLTTSDEIEGKTKKYLGIYAGVHSKFDVTTSYIKTLLRYGLNAIRTQKLDGVVAWETMMNKPSSGIFKSYNNDSTPSSLFVKKIDDGRLFAFYLNSFGKYKSNQYIGSFKNWQFVGSADFDSNGVNDILLRIGNGTINHVLLNTDGTIKNYSRVLTMNASWEPENTISDLNGDGNPDILIRKIPYQDLYILYLDNKGKYIGNKALKGFREWKVNASADFDNNGINDLLISNKVGTIARVLLDNNGSIKDASTIATMSNNWELENITGDFNGDGLSDILVRKKSDGTVYAFYLNNQGKYINHNLIGNLSGWKIKGVGDLDTNGVSDILLYRPTDGMMARILINLNGTIKDASKIASMSSNWQLE